MLQYIAVLVNLTSTSSPYPFPNEFEIYPSEAFPEG